MSKTYGHVKQTLLSFLRLRQHHRALRLNFPRNDGPDDTLLVPNGLIADEAMSCDFTITVRVLSDRPDITDKALLGKMVTISLVRDDGALRYFNGHIYTLRFIKNDAGFCHYEMILKPWLAFLRHSQNSYLFNGMTLQEQFTQLFSRYDGCDWTTTALDADDPMTDAFQFNESDYNYFHRRIEAKGWHYRYVHRADGHQLVLSADSTQCKPIDRNGKLTWQGSASGVKQSGVLTFSPVQKVTAGRYSASSFDFKHPGVTNAECSTIAAQGSLQQIDVIEHLGAYGFASREDGNRLARLRMEEIETKARQFDVSGNDERVEPGRTFKLSEHRDPLSQIAANDNVHFLIVSVKHTASNNYETTTQAALQAEPCYSNEFTCIDKTTVWRPGREFNSTDTKIHGIRTAFVVGLPNEEIHTDEYGRVRVQFHWDREGQFDTRSSAPMRVASGFAGDGYGQLFLPRAGQEVAIQCIDSNPDRPLITGCVNNAAQRPVRFSNGGKLPDQQNLSGIKSKEVNGGGYNQLRLDDTPGQISAQVASSHGQSQLNLGSLTHPRHAGDGKSRGEGFELATDHSGAVRSAHGLLLTAWERINACAGQLSCDEHVALMEASLAVFKTLSKTATDNLGQALDAASQAELADQVKNIGAAKASPIAVTSPDGLSFGSGKSIVSYSALNTDVVAQQHLQHAAGKKYAVNAGDGISLFARQNGIQQIAHYGKFVLQSQHDDMVINAAKNITMTADGILKLMADEIHLIAKDGSFAKLGGGITLGTNGNVDCKSAMLITDGPATMHTEMPYFSGDGKPPARWIALHYINPETAEGMPGAPYEIHFDGAPTITGTLDDSGKARHENVTDKSVTHVVYKPRPPSNDDDCPPLDALIA